MIHVGIDPGVTGAIAVLDTETRQVQFFDTPTVQVKSGKKFKNILDTGAIVLMLQNLSAGRGVFVTIEKVNAMPGRPGANGEGPRSMGATSAFNFGMGFGIWLGSIAALLLPCQQVHPLTWKKLLMADMGKEKDASRVKAMQLYPATAKDLNLKKHHGRADALLLAEFGRRNFK
jgi:crossover junction endodeoxyribonuclease RuvC